MILLSSSIIIILHAGWNFNGLRADFEKSGGGEVDVIVGGDGESPEEVQFTKLQKRDAAAGVVSTLESAGKDLCCRAEVAAASLKSGLRLVCR